MSYFNHFQFTHMAYISHFRHTPDHSSLFKRYMAYYDLRLWTLLMWSPCGAVVTITSP